ncbi:MAG: hypothetical protein Q8K26_00855, partial [Candidatus Gracilibacteria bacterium]|nr:hypothetical protein [Candidatus Gracilibacteria bacterium]
MLKLGNYLETKGIPGSAMPIYFTGSSYLGDTTNYNSKNKEKHYNTHMSILAGQAHMNFKAYEFGEVKNGTVVPFGDNKERINKEIARLKRDLETEKSAYTKYEANLREAVKLENNPDLIKRLGVLDTIINRYTKHITDTEKQNAMKQEIQKLFATKNPGQIKTELSRIIKYPVTNEDANYIIVLQSRKEGILNGLEKLAKALDKKDTSEFTLFDASEYKSVLAGSNVFEAFTRYNTTVTSIRKIEEQIATQKQILTDTHKLQVTKAAEREVAERELKQLLPEFEKTKAENVQAKKELLDMLDPEKNKALQERLTNLEKKILQRVGNNPGKVEPFMRALRANDTTTLMGQFRQSEADCIYLRTLLANKNKIETSIATIKTHLGINTTPDQLATIESENLGRILG